MNEDVARATLADCDAAVERLRTAAERAQRLASKGDFGWMIASAALDQGRKAEADARARDRSTVEGVLAAIAAGNRAFGWYRLARIEFDSAPRAVGQA